MGIENSEVFKKNPLFSVHFVYALKNAPAFLIQMAKKYPDAGICAKQCEGKMGAFLRDLEETEREAIRETLNKLSLKYPGVGEVFKKQQEEQVEKNKLSVGNLLNKIEDSITYMEKIYKNQLLIMKALKIEEEQDVDAN